MYKYVYIQIKESYITQRNSLVNFNKKLEIVAKFLLNKKKGHVQPISALYSPIRRASPTRPFSPNRTGR